MTKTVNVAGFEIAYRNENAFWQTYQEIFEDGEYAFVCLEPHPLILDCGSHIGLSVMYFKRQYPAARIIAFEPDPINYELLQRNIRVNDLRDVVTINAAVADYTGYAAYYQEVIVDAEEPDTRGYSISRSWGDRGHSHIARVKTVQLSTYIQEPISYLKLDVEGVEQAVLHEITKKLKYVQQMGIEYHGTLLNSGDNDLHAIIDLLRNNCFEIEITVKELQAFLPSVFDEWVKMAAPVLSKINAIRNKSPLLDTESTLTSGCSRPRYRARNQRLHAHRGQLCSEGSHNAPARRLNRGR